MTDKKKGFFATHLDPGGIFGEILFGLIMVLTFTLGAGLTAEDGPEGVRMLLIAALGCNIAWGVIDGAMYVMGCLLDRGRRNRMLVALKDVTDEAAALQIMEDELEGPLTSLLTPTERQAAYRDIWRISARAQPDKPKITKDDFMGGVASALLVILTALPGAIPFVFMDDKLQSLRASNGILLGLLFFCGYFWAKYTGVNRILAGLAMTLIGVVLVVAAILLGG
jgi:hypothetical protein